MLSTSPSPNPNEPLTQGSKFKKIVRLPFGDLLENFCVIKVMFRFRLLKVLDIVRYGMGHIHTIITKIRKQINTYKFLQNNLAQT